MTKTKDIDKMVRAKDIQKVRKRLEVYVRNGRIYPGFDDDIDELLLHLDNPGREFFSSLGGLFFASVVFSAVLIALYLLDKG